MQYRTHSFLPTFIHSYIHPQAILENKGFPAQAARAAAQTINSSAHTPLPPMQPGATMQAMANFQQAAAAAMQAAMQGMRGVSAVQMTVTPAPGQDAQQAYQDTMTALAMQQAAAAHMGAAFLGHAHHQMQLQQQQQQAAVVAAAAQAVTAAAPTIPLAVPTVAPAQLSLPVKQDAVDQNGSPETADC